jgi:hypothetical protein
MLLSDRYNKIKSGYHKFFIGIEIVYKFHKEQKEFTILVEKTRKPNVGDLMELFRKEFEVEMELKALNPWEFCPVELRADGIVKIIVSKIFVDPTYK